jgi:hypothetical protein
VPKKGFTTFSLAETVEEQLEKLRQAQGLHSRQETVFFLLEYYRTKDEKKSREVALEA